MKKSWPIVKLGEVLKQRKEFVTIDDLIIYKRPRVQLHAQGIVLRDQIPGSLIKTKTQQVCQTGEFLVAEIDAKVGGYGILPAELNGSVVSSHYFLFVINEAKLDRRFLDFFIRTPSFRDQVAAQGSTNYAAIRPSQVLNYEIPLPPLAEQRRIVARIEELAAHIHEAQALRQQAAEQAEALVVRSAAAIFDSIGNRVRLGDICDTSSGGTPSRDRADFFAGDIPWIKSGELKDDYIDKVEEHITEQAVQSSSAKLFPSGTVLVALYGANVGKTGILSIEATTNQAVCAIFPTKVINRDFIWWFLRRMRPVFVEDSFGGAQPNISQKIIRDTKIPAPSLAEQRRIVAELDALQAEVNRLKVLQAETAAELDAMLPSLLDRAFKGEL